MREIPQWLEEDLIERAPQKIEEILRPNEVLLISGELTDETANKTMNVLLSWRDTHSPDKEMTIVLHSAGGSVSAVNYIVDIMHSIENPIATLVVSYACSGAAVIAAAGQKGRRFALPDAMFLLHPPFTGSEADMGGSYPEVERKAFAFKFMHDRQIRDIAAYTGQLEEKVRVDIDHALILTSQEAKDYGIIDHIIPFRKDKKTGKVVIKSTPKQVMELRTYKEGIQTDPDLFARGGFNEEEVSRRMTRLFGLLNDPDTPEGMREEIEKVLEFHRVRREQLHEGNKLLDSS